MTLDDGDLRLVMLLIEVSELPGPETLDALDLLARIQLYRQHIRYENDKRLF